MSFQFLTFNKNHFKRNSSKTSNHTHILIFHLRFMTCALKYNGRGKSLCFSDSTCISAPQLTSIIQSISWQSLNCPNGCQHLMVKLYLFRKTWGGKKKTWASFSSTMHCQRPGSPPSLALHLHACARTQSLCPPTLPNSIRLGLWG